MNAHVVDHLWLAGAVLCAGVVLARVAYHLLGASDPKDAAQRELDRKSRWPS